MSATDRLASQAAAMAEANTVLRKIAAHVPARIWIEAKEKAGFGTEVRAAQIDDPKADEVWLQFVAAGPEVHDDLHEALKQLLVDVQAFDKSGTFAKLRSVQRATELVR